MNNNKKELNFGFDDLKKVIEQVFNHIPRDSSFSDFLNRISDIGNLNSGLKNDLDKILNSDLVCQLQKCFDDIKSGAKANENNSSNESDIVKCCDLPFQAEKKFYRCLTCNIKGVYAVCGHCSTTCHRSHDLELVGSGKGNCDCKKFSSDKKSKEHQVDDVKTIHEQPKVEEIEDNEHKCDDSNIDNVNVKVEIDETKSEENIQDNSSMTIFEALEKGICTYNAITPENEVQVLYDCEFCHFTGICRSCAKNCHSGHRLSVSRSSAVKCSCWSSQTCTYLSNNKKEKRKCVSKQCTYDLTGKQYIRQPFYTCFTCSLTGSLGFCAGCIDSCHKGHKIQYKGDIFAFCDCPLE